MTASPDIQKNKKGCYNIEESIRASRHRISKSFTPQEAINYSTVQKA